MIYKSIALFLLLTGILFSVSSKGQSAPAWDSSFRPNSFQVKVKDFKRFPKNEGQVVFLGNSITAQTDWSELMGMPNLLNRGISGDITFGILERLDEVIDRKPEKVFLLIGINDISRNIPDEVILQNFRHIIQRLQKGSPQTQLYLQTILPTNNTFTKFTRHYNREKNILYINSELKKLAKLPGVGLIDLHQEFLLPNGQLDSTLTHDGLHLNEDGYKKWKSILLEGGYLKKFKTAPFEKIGHRGARGYMPENTIPSMYAAIDRGVTTLEIDVVLDRNNEVIVSHDAYFVAAITTTPQGKHLSDQEAVNHLLWKMDYDSIRKYDVGLKPHPGFPKQEKIAAYKPLLSELMDSSITYAAARGKIIKFNIELKSNPYFEGKRQPSYKMLVDAVMEVVRSKKAENISYLQSFDIRPLQYINNRYGDMVTAYLVNGQDKRTLAQQLDVLGYKPEIYSPAYELVTKQLVKECQQRNIKLIPWTVNTAADIERLKKMGVDGIITDYPDLLNQ